MGEKLHWIVDLRILYEGRHKIQTRDASTREGAITEVKFNITTVLGRELKAPAKVILDGDETDYIPWENVQSIEKLP